MVRRIRSRSCLLVVLGLGCTPPPEPYAPPALPRERLASIQIEDRAHVESVDGHPLPTGPGQLSDEFFVSDACHELVVTYEESFVRAQISGNVLIVLWTPELAVATSVASLESVLASSKAAVHEYKSDVPIRFHVPARGGTKYWLTSTFDGDRFSPRIAVLNSAGERRAVILPDQPCAAAH